MSHSVFAAIDFAKALSNKLEPSSRRRGWVVSSNMLEPPLGGGAGELCVKACRPKDGFGWRKSNHWPSLSLPYCGPTRSISSASCSHSNGVKSVSGGRTGPPGWPTISAPALMMLTA
jgi:hypothetical protein